MFRENVNKFFFCKLSNVLLTLPCLQQQKMKLYFFWKFIFKLVMKWVFKKNNVKGFFEYVTKNTSSCVWKILNYNQRQPKLTTTTKKNQGCFTQVQQVTTRNKKFSTSPGYFSINTTKNKNSTSRLRRKKSTVKL